MRWRKGRKHRSRVPSRPWFFSCLSDLTDPFNYDAICAHALPTRVLEMVRSEACKIYTGLSEADTLHMSASRARPRFPPRSSGTMGLDFVAQGVYDVLHIDAPTHGLG